MWTRGVRSARTRAFTANSGCIKDSKRRALSELRNSGKRKMKHLNFNNILKLAAQDSKLVLSLFSSRSRLTFSDQRNADVWDREYSTRRWDYLKQLDQLSHYSVIAGYYSFFRPQGTVLDVGCGVGILQKRLTPYQYARYVGVDMSSQAINQASEMRDEKTSFVVADATTFHTDERYDVIIFNECLQLFSRPLQSLTRYARLLNKDGVFLASPLPVIRRYARFLRKGGLFIISMHVTMRSLHIWKTLESVYDVEDEVTVYNKRGNSWIIKVMKQSGK